MSRLKLSTTRLNLSTTFCIEDNSRFQFIYASQVSGILFSVYACMHLDSNKTLIEAIEFIMVNHTKLGSNDKFGFKQGINVKHSDIQRKLPNSALSRSSSFDCGFRSNMDTGKNPKTDFILPIEKNSNFNHSFFKPKSPMLISDIENKNFNILREMISVKEDEEGMDCDQTQKLVGITCIESNLFMLR